MAPSWPPRSRSTSKGVFFKKLRFSNGKTMIFKVLGVEVEAKNRSKIDEKMKLSWEGFIFSIFMDFSRFWRPSWPQVGVQDRPKIDTKNSLKNGRFSRGQKMGFKNFPGPGGGEHSGAVGGPEILDPLNDQNQRKSLNH